MNEVETDRAFRNFALEWVRNNPVAAIKLYVGKFVQFFAYREVLKTPIAGVEFFQTVVAIAYYPLLFLSVVGVIYFAVSNGSRGEITMFALYLMTAAVHAVFLQRFRYRVEVDFLLIVIAANFLASLFRQIRSRQLYCPDPALALSNPNRDEANEPYDCDFRS